MQLQLSANGLHKPTNWHAINWHRTFRKLKNLRGRIFRAAKEGDFKKLRSLQKLMLRSYANALISVRRITQINAGKNTPGIDKKIISTAAARALITDELLKSQSWKAKPARRIYIPKPNGKLRPLGIPVIKDRCLQSMIVNALEPEWESKFEASSYGFRPGRGCHDAIARIFASANPTGTRQWIIDADIKGAFDNIDHTYLLQKIHAFPGKELIKQWLKAGYMEGNIFHETSAGTPQGGSCSPLLANIALHGLEEELGIGYRKGPRTTGDRRIIRYADDFVIFCLTKQDAEQTVVRVKEWLGKRGLELSEEKTRVVNITEGFDFLGFNIRQYPSKAKKLKKILLIKPSNKSMQKIRDRIKAFWLTNQTTPAASIIKSLTPIIRGWTNYFHIGVAKKSFASLDRWMFHRAWRYAKRLHPKKSVGWRVEKYWGRFNLDRNDNWVFGVKKTGAYLHKFQWTKIERHVMVKGINSPDDPTLTDYWKARIKKRVKELKPSNQQIAKAQNYLCPICRTTLFSSERLDLHHVLPKKSGGKNFYQNLKLVHESCHRQIHSKSYKDKAIENGILAVSHLLEPDVL